MPAAEISPGWGARVCGGCLGLTWKRVASPSGEVSPLVWLEGGIGDLGTKGESCICPRGMQPLCTHGTAWHDRPPAAPRGGGERQQLRAPNWDRSAR